MRILITNVQLDHRTGTEIVVRDLAIGLRDRGHEVAVYTPNLGVISDEIRSAGVSVVDDPSKLTFTPDVIHGHHHTPTVAALEAFPSTPALFVCHDRFQPEDLPVRLASVRRYVAVDLNCFERLAYEAGITTDLITVIPNAVDLRRFPVRGPLPQRPARAALFSNNTFGAAFPDIVREACAAAGITLDLIGAGAGTTSDDPGSILGQYDLVFAKARCALEALVSGCAVVLIDSPGLGPMVNRADVDVLRDWNLGMRCLQAAPTVERVLAAINRYDADDARDTAAHTRESAGLDTAIDRYEELYRAISAGETTRIEVDSSRSQTERALGDALDYAVSLERRLRASDTPLIMPPLPPTIAGSVEVRFAEPPATMEVGTTVTCRAVISNRSGDTLASIGRTPVRISYHWYRVGSTTPAVFEGVRTELSRPSHPGTDLEHGFSVLAPAEPGLYELRLTLVQESVCWFDQLEPPVVSVAVVAVRPLATEAADGHDRPSAHPRESLSLAEIAGLTPLEIVTDGRFASLGFIDDTYPDMLTFVGQPRLVARALGHGSITAVITTAELATRFPTHIGVAVADDPKRALFQIHNALTGQHLLTRPTHRTTIDPTARIHPTAWVNPWGVSIAAHVVIGPNAVIEGPAEIASGVRIDAGAVIGATAFQTSARDGDYIELEHIGGVMLGPYSHVFANAVIVRGVFRNPTTIGARCSIGNGAIVSHHCRLEDHVFIGHGAVVNGRVSIGSGSWVGPGSTISNSLSIGQGSTIALGSVVVQDVAAGSQVSGPTALDHHTMLRHTAGLKRSNRST